MNNMQIQSDAAVAAGVEAREQREAPPAYRLGFSRVFSEEFINVWQRNFVAAAASIPVVPRGLADFNNDEDAVALDISAAQNRLFNMQMKEALLERARTITNTSPLIELRDFLAQINYQLGDSGRYDKKILREFQTACLEMVRLQLPDTYAMLYQQHKDWKALQKEESYYCCLQTICCLTMPITVPLCVAATIFSCRGIGERRTEEAHPERESEADCDSWERHHWPVGANSANNRLYSLFHPCGSFNECGNRRRNAAARAATAGVTSPISDEIKPMFGAASPAASPELLAMRR